MNLAPQQTFDHSPFELGQAQAYRHWRERKLRDYPSQVEQLLVPVQDPSNLMPEEKQALLAVCRKTNMVLYQSARADLSKSELHAFCQQLGLRQLDSNLCADEDGISSIQVEPRGQKREYIPYSECPINWHTDGYYNRLEHRIRGMVLHCIQPAASGGVNGLIDPERVYIALRDQNPDYIQAFMQADVMTIPPNIQAGVEIRGAQTGPVFSVDANGELHMRYTARTRSIEWKQDSLTQQAVSALEGLLSANEPYIFHHRLQPGQGVISNNVIHSRSRFEDGEAAGQKRLIYRARFYDRVADSGFRTLV